MTDAPSTSPTPEDLAELTAALDATTPGRLATLVTYVRRAVAALCWVVGGTGLVVVGLALSAWRSNPPALLISLLVGVPTMALAVYVARRTGHLARALINPSEVLAQARDLVSRATDSPELRRMVTRLRRRKGTASPGVGRIRRAIRSGRTLSSVIGLLGPDPKRHDHLVAFTPERLRHLWLAIWVGLWFWLAAAVTATVSSFAVLLRAL